jgi:predicted ArsR family transcriptional regulator
VSPARPARDRADERLGRLAALAEPVRRALYRYVASRGEPVSREQAAQAVGVARHTAKFHLDRLESEGLLDASYQRPAGRRGPGAGRPAKVYRPHEQELSVSLPERRYELVGAVLAAAIDTATGSGVDLADAVQEAAESAGREIGDSAAGVEAALAEVGYQPRPEGGALVLDNCPFHRLASTHTDLVCGVNLAFVRGLLESTGTADRYEPRLDPAPGRCCGALARARTAESSSDV